MITRIHWGWGTMIGEIEMCDSTISFAYKRNGETRWTEAQLLVLHDMENQKGDSMRGRRTAPLVLGDGVARWIIAVAMVFWGAICPVFWRSSRIVVSLSVSTSLLVGLRSLLLRDVNKDKLTFRLWNAWVLLLYLMPLL